MKPEVNKVFSWYFDNIEEVIKRTEVEQIVGPGSQISYKQFYLTGRDPKWTGGIGNATQYKEILKTGYLPAVEALQIDQVSTGQRYEFLPSVSGQFNDIGAYIEGRPECMGEFAEQEANKYLTVLINASTPAKMGGSTLMETAKLIFSSIQEMEANRIRVKIVIVFACIDRRSKNEYRFYLNVKNFEENFIPSLHGLLVGHLATVRGILYSYASLYVKDKQLGWVTTVETEEPNTINLSLMDNKEKLQTKLKAA